MNIKKIIISMTTFLCLFFAVVFLLNFNNGEEGKLDITKVNDVVKTVEENWNSDFQKAIDKAQNYGFDISIIANNEEVKGVSREGLSTSINEAIKNRDTIADVTVNNELVGKVVFYNNDSYIYKQLKNRNLNVSILCIMVFYIITIGYFIYINKVVVKPFNKLKKFARSVAIGNLDMPLAMDKDNIFGAFTESFDIMREELKIARENERKANESKKELVASLSHDIKTPLASIKAINELMSVQVANNKQKEKLATIDKKVNQIELLINNLFHATLEELKELKVESKDEQSCILKEIINDADYDNKVKICNIEECIIKCDKLRMQQIFDNVISNSYKYANTDIEITSDINEEYLIISIRDFGKGVSNDEIPLLTQKFYRGKNADSKNGSGIGLYVSKYFMEKMNGRLEINNKEQGFEVQLKIRLS